MDWPPRVHVTGWFFLNSKHYYSPPPDLQTYLGAGEPPICISFGSMVNRNVEEIDRIVGDSLRQTGSRGIILSGWSRVGRRSSDKILYMDSVSHDWLLPQCRLIIHHGGAGTTSAGLRAGIPSIVVPFTADQPFWGRRVHAMGAGPKPFSLKKLSVEKLTQAILQAKTDAYRERAEVIGRTIRSEGGTEAAVGLIEKYSNEFHTH
jgi:sterol 3beta-glucosyltransferase